MAIGDINKIVEENNEKKIVKKESALSLIYKKDLEIDPKEWKRRDPELHEKTMQKIRESFARSRVEDAKERARCFRYRCSVDSERGVKKKLTEKKIIIKHDDTGHTYETIFGDYLKGASRIVIEDPYIRYSHQVANFSHFCTLLMKFGDIKNLFLTTSFKDNFEKKQTIEQLDNIKNKLSVKGIKFAYEFIKTKHARNIICDNGWEISIDRGLDIYQTPKAYNGIESFDFSLKKCKETHIIILRIK